MVWYGRSGREWGGAGWVGRVGYIVYIGTESIAKTIVQAQRGYAVQFSQLLAHTIGRVWGGSQWDFSESLGTQSCLCSL